MSRLRLLCAVLLAAWMSIGVVTPAAAQMYPPDEGDGYDYPAPSAPRHGRRPSPRDIGAANQPDDGYGYGPGAPPYGRGPSQRDIDAAYPPGTGDEYGDPSLPHPYESMRGGGSGGPASDRMLEGDSGQTTKVVVEYPTRQAPGTIVIDTTRRKLFVVQAGGQAISYGIGVGREGFAWKGLARVGRKSEWPAWIPPAEMLQRRPELPVRMEGGIENPLGARALYLFHGNADTLFRIHGTNEPDSIGKAVSSGCIRMLNTDVIDLYRRIPVGTRVVVL